MKNQDGIRLVLDEERVKLERLLNHASVGFLGSQSSGCDIKQYPGSRAPCSPSPMNSCASYIKARTLSRTMMTRRVVTQ
eukprot:1064335-Amphidinium_carterae.1